MPRADGQAGSSLHFVRFLDTNGDGSGNKNGTGDFSGAVTEFFIQPAIDRTMEVGRLSVQIKGSGSFRASGYGNQNTALTNGITVQVRNNGNIISFTDGIPITQNSNWEHISTSAVVVDTWAGNGDTLVATFIALSPALPIRLHGPTNDRISIFLNDDFSFLVEQSFLVVGRT